MHPLIRIQLAACALASLLGPAGPSSQAAAPIPEAVRSLLSTYCLDCHRGEAAEAEVDFARLETDRAAPGEDEFDGEFWQRVIGVLADGQMPPEEASQPTQDELSEARMSLERWLARQTSPGGTLLRRLNRREYEKTVSQLFALKDFRVPDGFPPDRTNHRFDTVAESLVLSPPLMEAYNEAARLVADSVLPPEPRPVESSISRIPAEEMAISYSSSSIRNGAMRLVSKTNSMFRSCSWPAKFEAKTSGIYRIRVRISAFGGEDTRPMRFELRARSFGGDDGEPVQDQRLLGEWDISSAEPTDFELETELYKGETLLFHYANAPLDENAKDEFAALLRSKFAADQRLLAAWQAVEHNQGLRGGVGWQRVKALMESEDLDVSEATVDSKATEKLIATMRGSMRLYVETVSYQHFEEGPAIDVHHAVVEGPLQRVEDEESRRQKAITQRFLGQRQGRDDRVWAEAILRRVLTNAFRRPVSNDTVEAYGKIVADHIAEGHRLRDGLHLAIRTLLISPHFLYRELRPGELDSFDLATRLSYFLTSGPPDGKLFAKAESGQLRDPAVLEAEAKRLIESDSAEDFIRSFTSQWLGLGALEHIMPDPRLLNFTSSDAVALEREAEMFFAAMLRENHPMEDFIDPDFTFTNAAIGQKIYDRSDLKDETKSEKMRRVSLERGGRYGGILGQAAVMMATANGVDTQPVLRGVWVLENVLGDPPPPPPQAVPAITPDTRGAKTVRELLQAHAAEPSCARCHQKIDPLGFALENFDPVGRWRTHYPLYESRDDGEVVEKQGPPVDATGRLPDGTELKDVTDLKAYVVENIDLFSACLGEKLLVYATGRPLNYAEQQEVDKIVRKIHDQGNGFRDLLLALIQSETFRTK